MKLSLFEYSLCLGYQEILGIIWDPYYTLRIPRNPRDTKRSLSYIEDTKRSSGYQEIPSIHWGYREILGIPRDPWYILRVLRDPRDTERSSVIILVMSGTSWCLPLFLFPLLYSLLSCVDSYCRFSTVLLILYCHVSYSLFYLSRVLTFLVTTQLRLDLEIT